MKQFDAKDLTIESEAALSMIKQQPVRHYSKYIGMDVQQDAIAIAITSADSSKPPYY
jgi:hypothetical protein